MNKCWTFDLKFSFVWLNLWNQIVSHPKDSHPECHCFQSPLNRTMGWGGRVWVGQRSTHAQVVSHDSAAGWEKGQKSPLSIFFLQGKTKRRWPAHTDLLNDGRQNSKRAKGGVKGGRGRIRRRSFIKEQNIYRKLHSRLLSAVRSLSTRPPPLPLWNMAG